MASTGDLHGVRPPPGMSAGERRLFLSIRRELHAQGTWQDSDAGALERYVRALERARTALEIVEREGMTAEGASGQPVTHPALRIAREAERDAADYARDLLLTPASRRRAGLGETSGLDEDLRELLG